MPTNKGAVVFKQGFSGHGYVEVFPWVQTQDSSRLGHMATWHRVLWKNRKEKQIGTARLGCSTGVLRNKLQFFSRLQLVGRVQDSQTSLAFAVLLKGRAFDDAMLRCGLDTTLEKLQFTVGFHMNYFACVVLVHGVGAPGGLKSARVGGPKGRPVPFGRTATGARCGAWGRNPICLICCGVAPVSIFRLFAVVTRCFLYVAWPGKIRSEWAYSHLPEDILQRA